MMELKSSRILQHIENNKSFSVISAFRNRADVSSETNAEINKKKHQELKTKVRELGLGFTEMTGGFVEDDKMVQAKSLFIANIKTKDAIKLGKEFDQWSVLYKDENGFAEIGTNDESDVGKILTEYKNASDSDNFTYFRDVIKIHYSQLLKGNKNKSHQIVFVKEVEPTNFNRVVYNSNIPLSELDLNDIHIT